MVLKFDDFSQIHFGIQVGCFHSCKMHSIPNILRGWIGENCKISPGNADFLQEIRFFANSLRVIPYNPEILNSVLRLLARPCSVSFVSMGRVRP